MDAHAPSASPQRRSLRGESGFSLIELLVVIVVLGILAAVAVPVFLAQQNRAHDSVATSDLITLRKAQMAYAMDNAGTFTANGNELTAYGAVRSTAAVPAITVSDSAFCAEVVSNSSRIFSVTNVSGIHAGPCADSVDPPSVP